MTRMIDGIDEMKRLVGGARVTREFVFEREDAPQPSCMPAAIFGSSV